MKRITTSFAAAFLTIAGLTVPANSAGSIPVPEADPFYAVPADIAGYANGAVISSRPVSASALSLPLPASAWQVKYRTTDSKGRPSATVTTVLVPLLPWLGRGTRPLLSYQTAEDGVAGKCAPSGSMKARHDQRPVVDSHRATGAPARAVGDRVKAHQEGAGPGLSC